MTNDNIIEIKKRNKNWFLNGFIYLLLMLGSLLIALFPLVNQYAQSNKTTFLLIGLAAFIGSACLYAFNIYSVLKPQNALILSARGFIDTIDIGEGIEIEWTNVTAVKMLGKSNMPFLGVTLENTDVILSKMNKKLAADMRENIDQNLPTILIPQSKIKTPIKELKDTFAKLAREARALEKESQQKQKHNPFTTDDVLRAFGKLPKEEPNKNDRSPSAEDECTAVTEEPIFNQQTPNESFEQGPTASTPNIDDENETDSVDDNPAVEEKIADNSDFDVKIINSLSGESPFEIPEEITTDYSNTQKQSASDYFYQTLRTKAILKSDEITADTENTVDNTAVIAKDEAQNDDEEMPDEIKSILSRSRASRIAEIEKLLNETDLPYSLSRENNKAAAEEKETENDTVGDGIGISFDNREDNSDNFLDGENVLPPCLSDVFDSGIGEDDDNFQFDLSFISSEDSKQDDESSLDDLIQRELASTEFSASDDLSDTKEFIFDN